MKKRTSQKMLDGSRLCNLMVSIVSSLLDVFDRKRFKAILCGPCQGFLFGFEILLHWCTVLGVSKEFVARRCVELNELDLHVVLVVKSFAGFGVARSPLGGCLLFKSAPIFDTLIFNLIFEIDHLLQVVKIFSYATAFLNSKYATW